MKASETCVSAEDYEPNGPYIDVLDVSIGGVVPIPPPDPNHMLRIVGSNISKYFGVYSRVVQFEY
jgi:hypothetical protein